MIVLVIRTLDGRGARDVHGVIGFRYDQARMDVSVSYPNERGPSETEEERFGILRCATKISEWASLPKLEAFDLLRSAKTHFLEVEPLPPKPPHHPEASSGTVGRPGPPGRRGGEPPRRR